MSTESDLKKMFRETGPSLGQIDISLVLRRSSRRRVAQRVAVGSATTLAVAGIGVAGFTGIRGLVQSTGSASSAAAPDANRPTLIQMPSAAQAKHFVGFILQVLEGRNQSFL